MGKGNFFSYITTEVKKGSHTDPSARGSPLAGGVRRQILQKLTPPLGLNIGTLGRPWPQVLRGAQNPIAKMGQLKSTSTEPKRPT